MKICGKCKKIKAISCFNKKGKGLSSSCKDCNKEYLKKHYLLNKKYYSDKTKKRVLGVRDFLFKIKEKLKCSKCEENDVACLDFHHVNANEKEVSIALISSKGWSEERMLKEINKCIVLCSNCHRKHHYYEDIGSNPFGATS
jgi:hypothetical protein